MLLGKTFLGFASITVSKIVPSSTPLLYSCGREASYNPVSGSRHRLAAKPREEGTCSSPAAAETRAAKPSLPVPGTVLRPPATCPQGMPGDLPPSQENGSDTKTSSGKTRLLKGAKQPGQLYHV